MQVSCTNVHRVPKPSLGLCETSKSYGRLRVGDSVTFLTRVDRPLFIFNQDGPGTNEVTLHHDPNSSILITLGILPYYMTDR